MPVKRLQHRHDAAPSPKHDGSGAFISSNGGDLTAIDPVTGVAVTIATTNPPLTLPLLHITVYSPVNVVDPQWAKQEAALIGNLTMAGLVKTGVPALFASVVGSQVGVSLSSPEDQAALQAVNSLAANGIGQTAEAATAALYGISLAAENGPVNGYGTLDHSGPGS